MQCSHAFYLWLKVPGETTGFWLARAAGSTALVELTDFGHKAWARFHVRYLANPPPAAGVQSSSTLRWLPVVSPPPNFLVGWCTSGDWTKCLPSVGT